MTAGQKRSTKSRLHPAGRVIVAALAVLLTLLLSAHVALALRFNTTYVSERLDNAVMAGTDSLYRARIESARFSLFGRSFAITGLRIYPDTAVFRRRDSASQIRRTKYSLTAGSVRGTGLGLRRLLGGGLQLAAVSLDSLLLEVELDNARLREPPATAAILPHLRFWSIKEPIRIGRIVIARSHVVYAERAFDGSRFGTVGFTEIAGTFSNVTNDPRRMSRAAPCVVELRSRVGGGGWLVAHFEWDLSTPGLNLNYHGTIAGMDARPLNSMVVALQGLRIRSGHMDATKFNVRVEDDSATGELQVLYHDLEVETLDKDSGNRGVGDVLGTFFANHFKLHSGNPSGDKPPRTSALALRRVPEFPLFKFIWHTLRPGLFENAGI